jgi:hypothetical protein
MKEETYPALTEQGEKEAQIIMDTFKKKMAVVADEVISSFYTDVSFYVESDHWTNYRQSMINGLMGYKKVGTEDSYGFKELRTAIYTGNKEEIIKDLNADLVLENQQLKERIEQLLTPPSRLYP